MTETPETELDDILVAAAGWHTRLDLGTADVRAFEAWRDADPRHAAAFARMEGTDGAVARVRNRIEGEVDAYDVKSSRPSRRQWLGGALAGTGVVVLGGGGLFAAFNQRAHADTRVGERQSLSIANDARLDINTDSKVSWRVAKHTTEIWLNRGEIGLSIMPVKGRAFRIHAGGLVVVVRYGMLNIRLRRNDAEVTLLAGPGAVATGDERQADVVLSLARGQSISLKGGAGQVRSLTTEELDSIRAWRSDEMLFTGQTLAVVIEEYNRYLVKKIIIRDPSLSSVRLGGRFNVHSPADLLASLHNGFGIRVTETPEAIELSR